MRKSASEIIRNLEMRVARLEKHSSAELETLKELLKIPFGKARYVRDPNKYYFSSLRNEVDVISEVWEEYTYGGMIKSYMKFNVASVKTEDVNVRKIQSELKKEVQILLTKSSLLKEKAREVMREEEEIYFTNDYEDGRFYDFDRVRPVKVSVEVSTSKSSADNKNWVIAKVMIEQYFTYEQKGEF